MQNKTYDKIVIYTGYISNSDFLKVINLKTLVGTTIQSYTEPNHTFVFTEEMLESGHWDIEDVGRYDSEYKLVFDFLRVKSASQIMNEQINRQFERLRKKFEQT